MNEVMNIVFLDVDGVINSQRKLIEVYELTHKPHSGYNYPFDERCLENLKELIIETNSKIVITSTWRKDNEGKEILLSKLREYDLEKDVIGFVPILNTLRGIEIEEYIKSLSHPINFVILDDDSDMGELKDYLIKTNNKNGLTKKDTENAKILLLKQSKK